MEVRQRKKWNLFETDTLLPLHITSHEEEEVSSCYERWMQMFKKLMERFYPNGQTTPCSPYDDTDPYLIRV